MADVKVIYILGFARSGSTILGNILGEQDDFFHAGELCYFWSRSNQGERSRPCGCGRPVPQCPVWSAVLSSLATQNGPDAEEAADLEERIRSRGGWPLVWTPNRQLEEPLLAFRGLTQRLYQRIGEVTGARVVVDSSKSPRYGALLATVPGFDVRFVHVVRDPRAIMYSRQRKRMDREGADARIRRSILVKDALDWAGKNLEAEVVGRRAATPTLLVRHEDFTRDPAGVVGRILDGADESEPLAAFLAEDAVQLGTNHTCGGNNRVRKHTGPVRILQDTTWTEVISPLHRQVVAWLTLPMLRRYGYPLRVA
ncbi:MAG: sulfotransferase [Actinomycetota bacterium]|nr:sulfotransferase [Actinomycetota bacterium]